MEKLFKLRDSVIEYLSPAKRRHTLLLATPSHNSNLTERPVQTLSEPRNLRGRAVISGRVSKKYLSPSDTKRSTRNPRSRTDGDDGYVDEMHDEHSSMTPTPFSYKFITPEDSSSQVRAPSDRESATNSSLKEETYVPDNLELSSDDESEVDVEAKVHQYLDRQTELARHREALEKIKDGKWHKDEAALFMKLTMRGFEPLIPTHWSFDFRTCPQTVFSNNMEETLINAKSGNEFRGTNALLSLVALGGRVRALLECGKPQEQVIKREIENYIKWSERDGGFESKRFIPILCLVAGYSHQDLPTISKAITDQMEFLALRHRQSLSLAPPGRLSETGEVEIFSRPPPVVYGVLVARCVTVFLTMDAGNPHAKPRTVAHFDFSNKDMDVWNGFAVAILVCMVRNQLMDSMEEMETETEGTDSDPDV